MKNEAHTKILYCSCESKQQDALHGLGRRAHNWAEKKQQWRCTVCTALKN